ncbi:MAG TPA: GntR family transcriptional regulator [Gemmobacter sp.]|nr:GntR family transcriptional regulator [Gemmobacter sp.]
MNAPEHITEDPPEPVRRAADSSDRAYRALRQALVDFRFHPGERIREARIAAEMELSRTPVREALNRLASEGFVTLVPNRGFFVRALDIDDLLDIHELRAIVESAAFARMCRRAEDAQIAALAEYWQSVQPVYAAHDADAILEADEGFHMMIAKASGNSEILALLPMINARIRFIRRILIDHARHDDDLVADHAQIVAAALARDAEGGAALMKSHIELTVTVAREALKDALLRLHSASARRSPTATVLKD